MTILACSAAPNADGGIERETQVKEKTKDKVLSTKGVTKACSVNPAKIKPCSLYYVERR